MAIAEIQPLVPPTIGNYLWAYRETIRKFRLQPRGRAREEFESVLRELIGTHVTQIRLLQQLTDSNAFTNPTADTRGDYAAGYVEVVQRLAPDTINEEFRRALQTLVRTHLYQIGILGGWEYPKKLVAPDAARSVTQATQVGGAGTAEPGAAQPDIGAETQDTQDEGGEDGGLKRCSDGSLVEHGVGCP